MGRKSTKNQRLDAMKQWQQRKFKRKNSPNSRKEISWTVRFFKELKADDPNNSSEDNGNN